MTTQELLDLIRSKRETAGWRLVGEGPIQMIRDRDGRCPLCWAAKELTGQGWGNHQAIRAGGSVYLGQDGRWLVIDAADGKVGTWVDPKAIGALRHELLEACGLSESAP
jgi:hypothetical protein